MRRISTLLIAALLAGCATVDYKPYEGKNNLYEGQGGTKEVVDGVEFWAHGTPPRKYSIVGFVTSEIGGGYGDEALIRTAVASEVKKQRGDAAIQVNNNKSFAGIVQTAPGMFMAASVKRMEFAVIRYAGAN